MVLGRYTDDVDFADTTFSLTFLDLEPAEAGHPVSAFEDEEIFGAEPGLGKARLQVFHRPVTVLGVAGEDAVVKSEPLNVVLGRAEGADCAAGEFLSGGWRPGMAVHMEEAARRLKMECCGEVATCLGVVVGPDIESRCMLGEGVGDDVFEECATNAIAPALRPDDNLAGDAADAGVNEGQGVRIADELRAFVGKEGQREVVPVLQAEELVLADGFVTVFRGCFPDEAFELFDVFTLEAGHNFYVVHGPRMGATEEMGYGVCFCHRVPVTVAIAIRNHDKGRITGDIVSRVGNPSYYWSVAHRFPLPDVEGGPQ